jgi:hypothetical protein
MKEKLKDAAEQIFCTKIGWAAIVALHVFVFMSMSPGGIFEVKNGSWPLYIGVPSTIILFLFGCVMMGYGIINIIKGWRERK